MSSTYSIVCMNHDPAIELGGHTLNSLAEVLALLDQPNSPTPDTQHLWPAWLAAHTRCDLLISRSSGSFIDFTCPPLRPTWGCQAHHSAPKTERVDWLRLLYHARQTNTPVDSPLEAEVRRFDIGCWGARRVERLMRLTGDEYAVSLEPLADPSAYTPIGTPPDTRVSNVNGEEYLGSFHGGCAEGLVMRVPAALIGKPCGVVRVASDTYDRDSKPDSAGVWHYRVQVSS